jgi:DNA-binding transcriptional MerR regulator
MTKAPLAFRTISEVSETLDVPQHVLRFWESKFPQVRPLKRAGGRRYYRPEDIDLLRGVRTLLYAEGYTIKGVQKVLRDAGAKHVGEVGRYGLHRTIRTDQSNVRSQPPGREFAAELDPAEPAQDSNGTTSGDLADGDNLATRRAALEAALAELTTLRDLLSAARPKKADAA